jgi:hypothetical protein
MLMISNNFKRLDRKSKTRGSYKEKLQSVIESLKEETKLEEQKL